MAKEQTAKHSLFRQELLTQLTLQRARLLRSMLALDDLTFEQPLWDDYSIRRLLPHIALWDGFEAERLSLLRDGRLDELGWMPVEERNAAWHEAHAATTIDAGLAMLQKERRGLLNVVESAPDELLKATVTLNGDFQLSVLSCISSSVKHDEDHANDIAAWRKANDVPQWQNGSRMLLLTGLKATRRALKEMIALVISAQTSKKGPLLVDGWDIRATLAHLYGWEQSWGESIEAGRSLTGSMDLDQLNAQFVADSAETPLPELWTQFEATRRATEKWVENQSDTILYGSFQTRSEVINTPYMWTSMLIDHDVEHLEEIYTAYLMYTRLK